MKKVLVSHGLIYDEVCFDARKMLADNGWEIVFCSNGEETAEIYAHRLPELDAVLSGGERWDKETMQKCAKLKVISRFGVGYDNIDIISARELGIDVTNARVPALSDSVAELALCLIISALRDIQRLGGALRNGEWLSFDGRLLSKKTVGLIGFGGIAQSLARMLQGFNVRILAYDAAPDVSAAAKLGVALTDFETVLRESDVVSLHIPSTPETFHFINKEIFRMMKPTAIFVNTSRGKIVDEAAMYEALTAKRIAYAVSDVFEREPTLPDNPLLGLDNFLGVPHIGGTTYEAAHEMSVCAVQNILDCFEGKRPAFLLNP